ncbi:hypothetical protein Ddc_07807 [Ditylenchus destructor]|nr:hypothetical protein Ddc_07807 [Ditylenchus destructor]
MGDNYEPLGDLMNAQPVPSAPPPAPSKTPAPTASTNPGDSYLPPPPPASTKKKKPKKDTRNDDKSPTEKSAIDDDFVQSQVTAIDMTKIGEQSKKETKPKNSSRWICVLIVVGVLFVLCIIAIIVMGLLLLDVIKVHK